MQKGSVTGNNKTLKIYQHAKLTKTFA